MRSSASLRQKDELFGMAMTPPPESKETRRAVWQPVSVDNNTRTTRPTRRLAMVLPPYSDSPGAGNSGGWMGCQGEGRGQESGRQFPHLGCERLQTGNRVVRSPRSLTGG